MFPLSSGINQNLFRIIFFKTSKARKYSALKNENRKETTVDSREVNHLSQLRDEWWQTHGMLKPLHAMNLLRVPFVRDGLVKVPLDKRSSTPLTGKKILDVGCGGGILSMPLAKLGADVTGIDAGEELIEMARRHSAVNPPLPGKHPTYLFTSIEEHVMDYTNYYDGVIASEVIEHVANDKKGLFVKSCINTLKPGGRIFFTTPSRTRISQLATICVAENVIHAIPKGTHEYDKFITPNELKLLMETNGCRVESISGIIYNFLINEWQWINSTSFSFVLQAIKMKKIDLI